MTFAEWLASEMAARRMSLRMLAVRTGLDHSSISRLLKGDRDPLLSTAVRVIRALTPAKTVDYWSVANQEGFAHVATGDE